jgi:hypothetical protein
MEITETASILPKIAGKHTNDRKSMPEAHALKLYKNKSI